MPRFDEIELIPEPTPGNDHSPISDDPPGELPVAPPQETVPAPILRRSLGFITDVSLFIALFLALTPLLPQRSSVIASLIDEPVPSIALIAFLLLLSFVYFAGCWLIWGRTIGATIFEHSIVSEDGSPVDVRGAARRWLGTLLSLASAGLGFIPALFGEHRSLADRMSGSVAVSEPAAEP